MDIEAPLRFSDDYVRSTPGLDLRADFKKGIIDNTRYIQVFEDTIGFEKDLSVLDLLFCLGPQARDYLREVR